MRLSASLVLSTLVAAAVHAAPPTLDIPAEVRPAGQYALFTPRTDAVAVEFVGLDALEPVPSSVLKDARTFLLDTRGLRAGRYRFVAVGSSASGELARVAFALVVGDAPVPPGPGPTPPPSPEPTDPIWPQLKAAYAADATPAKAEAARKLAAVFRQAVATANDPAIATLGDLNGAVRTAGRTMVPLPALEAARQVVAAEFVARVGGDAASPLTPELRALAAAQFGRMATLWEALAK